MKQGVGYVLSIGGLIVLALGLGTFKVDLPLVGGTKSTIISIIGGILIIGGVIVLKISGQGDSKSKQEKPEVPIYQGDKIVGYRREQK